MACRRGFDEAHQRLHDSRELELSREEREALKELLFICHYAATSCGWKPEEKT